MYTTKTLNSFFKTKRNTLLGLKTVILILLAFIIFCPPFLRGLYFNVELFPLEILTFFTFILFFVYKLLRNEKKFLETPLDAAALIMVIVYFIALLFSINKRLALEEFLKYCMYFSTFIMISEYAVNKKVRLCIMWVTIASSVFICLLGFDGATGEHGARFFNEMFNILGIKTGFFDLFKWNRMSSTFQYPNTLAGYLIGVFYLSLGMLITMPGKLNKAILGGSCFLFLCTFIFTLSRGAYAIFPVTFIIMLILLPKGGRVKSVFYFLIPVVSNAIILFYMSKMLTSPIGNEAKIWLTLAAGMFISVLLTFTAEHIIKLLERISWKLYALSALSLCILIIAAILAVIFSTTNLVIDKTQKTSDTYTENSRNIKLEPGKEYRLIYSVDAINSLEKPYAYTIRVLEKNEKNTIAQTSQNVLAEFKGNATQGTENRELQFELPETSNLVQISIISEFGGTKSTFSNAFIESAWTGEKVKDITLNYKYIPDKLEERFVNFTASIDFIQRRIYIQDGLKILKDYWLVGAGGGAWHLLYFSYQKFYYVSRYAHNSIMQLGVETGIVGVLAFLFSIICFISMFLIIKNKKMGYLFNDVVMQVFIISGVSGLILHSMVDFDLSFPAVLLLLWELLAIFNSSFRAAVEKANFDTDNSKETKQGFILTAIRSFKKVHIKPIVGICAACILFLLVVSFQVGLSTAQAANRLVGASREKVTSYVKFAKTIDFTNPMHKIDYINLLLGKEKITQKDYQDINKNLLKLQSSEKNNPDIYQFIIDLNIKVGNFENAVYFGDKAVLKRPYSTEYWQLKIAAYYQAMINNFILKNESDAFKYTEKLLIQVNMAQNINKYNIKPFILNNYSMEMLEVAKYIKDNANKNIELDANKLIFYNYAQMDVNFDNIPDQWNSADNQAVNIKYSGDLMIINSKNNDITYNIRTRDLSLKPGKTYKIELKPLRGIYEETIPFSIAGVDQGYLTLTDGSFIGEFSTKEDFKSSNNSLVLQVRNHYEISNITIMEE